MDYHIIHILTKFLNFGDEKLNMLSITILIMMIPYFNVIINPIINKIINFIQKFTFNKYVFVRMYYQSVPSPDNQNEHEKMKAILWYLHENGYISSSNIQLINNSIIPYKFNSNKINMLNETFIIDLNIYKNNTKPDAEESNLIGTIDISVKGNTNKSLITFINYIENEYNKNKESKEWKLAIYSPGNRMPQLEEQTQLNKIDNIFDYIVLPTDVEIKIKDRIDSFIQDKEWYLNKNIKYKMIIYLVGSPGTGKTSLALLVARYLARDIFNIDMSLVHSNQILKNIFKQLRSQPFVGLIEELDCCAETHSRTKSKSSNGEDKENFNLGTLLAQLDGINQWNGQIIFITLNHKELLDDALIRPGRNDLIIDFDKLNKNDLIRVFKFYTDIDIPIDKLSDDVNKRFTPADIQNIVLDTNKDIGTIITKLNIKS